MPDEDNCACGLKYKTGGQLVAAVQIVIGSSLLFFGFYTIDYYCSDADMDAYYECERENWVSWFVALGGCFCVMAANLLLYGVQQTRPNGLMLYVGITAGSAIDYFIAAVLAISSRIQAIFVIIFFAVTIWFGFTVVFVYRYGNIMITWDQRTNVVSTVPRTRVIFVPPNARGRHDPGAPEQVINTGVQPGVYPAPYNPGASPGNVSPSHPYPSDFSQPPPFPGAAPPPSSEPQRADALPPNSSTDIPTNSS